MTKPESKNFDAARNAAMDRLVEIDLANKPEADVLSGILHRRETSARRKVQWLSAAALLLALGMLATALFYDPASDTPDDESALAKEDKGESEEGDKEDEFTPIWTLDLTEEFPELDAYPVLVGNHLVNPKTGKEVWRLDDEQMGTDWVIDPGQASYTEKGSILRKNLKRITLADQKVWTIFKPTPIEYWKYSNDGQALIPTKYASTWKRVELPATHLADPKDFGKALEAYMKGDLSWAVLPNGHVLILKRAADGTSSLDVWEAKRAAQAVTCVEGGESGQLLRVAYGIALSASPEPRALLSFIIELWDIAKGEVIEEATEFPMPRDATLGVPLVVELQSPTFGRSGKQGQSGKVVLFTSPVYPTFGAVIYREALDKPFKATKLDYIATRPGGSFYALGLAEKQPEADPRSQLATPPKAYNLIYWDSKGVKKWSKRIETHSDVQLFATAAGPMVTSSMKARLFHAKDGSLAWSHTESKGRPKKDTPRLLGRTIVAGLDNGKVALASYSRRTDAPIWIWLIDPKSGKASTHEIAEPDIDHTEFSHTTSIHARMGAFVVVSEVCGARFINVFSSKDGKRLHGWAHTAHLSTDTYKKFDLLSDEEVAAQRAKAKAARKAEEAAAKKKREKSALGQGG